MKPRMSKRQHKPKRYLYEDYEHLPPQGMREGGRSLRGIDPSSTETSQLSSNMPVMSCEQIGILMQTCEGEQWKIAGTGGSLDHVAVADERGSVYRTELALRKQIYAPCCKHSPLDLEATHCSRKVDCLCCQCGCGGLRIDCRSKSERKKRMWASDKSVRDAVACMVAGTGYSKSDIFSRVRGTEPLPHRDTISKRMKTHVYPTLLKMMHESIMSAILEAKIAYKDIHPEAKEPYPIAICSDGRWSKAYVFVSALHSSSSHCNPHPLYFHLIPRLCVCMVMLCTWQFGLQLS